MEHWHTKTSAPYNCSSGEVSSSRILTPSTGNIRSYVLDSNDGIENRNPYPSGAPSIKHENRPEPQYPIPRFKLGSNDHHAENIARLQARRQHNREKFGRRKRVDPERPYLQHPKYLQYRARQRCDTGADGKPVWDDRIEDAFQNALVNIEPMGRRKKSQRGRPHGRNELISEWIMEATGEHRSRKQVSSHIQVLNTLLKGIPEWDVLTTPDERIGPERPTHEYYSDSIAQLVRSQKSTGPNAFYSDDSRSMPPRPYGLPSNAGFVEKHNLTRLSFEMWVSLPNQMDQALHTYTRLQSSSSTLAPMPLENARNWRSSFPSLQPVVESWSSSDQCDIILLEASFQLMSDFPPKFSKLGISLELDFLHPSNNNAGSLANLAEWTCVTHMFQRGRLDKKLARESCHVSGLGKVKPFFESKWWASTFTHLTEKRKMAEDSKNDAAVDLANETSRNFFRGLTVMQEISVDTMRGGMSNGIYTDTIPRRKRMCILLWKFSQAPAGFVGTTTWQKLIPPPDRRLTNSPAPQADMTLPPLAMDTMVDNRVGDNLFSSTSNFMSGSGQQSNMFNTTMDDELYQDGFMGYRPETLSGFDDLHSTFDMPMSNSALDHDLNLSFDMQHHDLPHLQDHTASSSNNFFELPSQRKNGLQSTSLLPHASQHGSFHEADGHPARQPLVNFDLNTHQRLQAQLSGDGQHRNSMHVTQAQTNTSLPTSISTRRLPDDPEDEALRVALLSASSMSDVNHSQQSQQAQASAIYLQTPSASQPAYIPSSTNPFTFPPPVAVARPPLQTHHSFAGVGAGDVLHSCQPSRGDFEKTFANLQAYTEDHGIHYPYELNDATNHADGLVHEEASRPHSQPTLPATAAPMAPDVYDELHALHGGGMEHGHSFEMTVLDTPSTVRGRGDDGGGGAGGETNLSRADSGVGLGGSIAEVKREDVEGLH